MEDGIHNLEDRKKFCDTFTSGRMCKVTGLIVTKFFCVKICHGRPEEVDFPPEIKRNIQRYQLRQAIDPQGQSIPELPDLLPYLSWAKRQA